jgi:hydroxymethylpyrimidine kinase/phosphomethylpyrimidine kinase/thiamine-phosphate diphosphorylase
MNNLPIILTIQQAQAMLKKFILNYQQMEEAGKDIIALGFKQVFIKGENFQDDKIFVQNFWTNGEESCWIVNPKHSIEEEDAFFITAISTCLTLGYSIKDALIIATMHCRKNLRLSQTQALSLDNWPENQIDLPYFSPNPLEKIPDSFKPLNLGLYPIVDNSKWLRTLLPLRVSSIQLRIKNPNSNLENEIVTSIELAKQYKAKLFINDYWELAIKHGAFGVHLGQEDLESADINAIRKAGLYLGISSHCYYEVARAHTLHPSYIACGPIYPTTSKIMSHPSQGIEQLKRWKRTLNYPLVAIGGIHLGNINPIIHTKVEGISLISAITQAQDPRYATLALLKAVQRN